MREREIRTVMFTDVVASTRMRTTFGDDAVDEILAVQDAVVRSAVRDRSGEVLKGTGDGSLVVFGSARAALAAAVDIQRSLAIRRDEEPGPELSVRIAVHAGEVHDTGGDVLGEAVNAAARILDHASGGEIVVSRVIRDLVGTSEVAFVERGDYELRGFPTRFELFTVRWSPELARARLDVRLLGNPAVHVDGQVVEAFAAPRLQRLVALLSVEPGTTIPRSRVAFRLWPDSPEPQARTNLRKLLHDLRRAIPDIEEYAHIDQQGLRWRAGSSVHVDVVEFLGALEAGDDEAAVGAYGGDLLPDCYEDWVIEVRDRLRTKAGEALDRLAAAAEDRGDASSATAHARARLALDPLWEPAYQRMMRAQSQLGNRGEALQVYHRCAEILQAELGVEPDPSTRRAYEQIRGASSASPTAGRLEVAATSAFVGRQDELAEAVSVWNETAAGRACLLLVTGEPGVGKTRLVDELTRSVRTEATIGRSRAYEAAARLPWGPVVEWLRTPEVRSWLTQVDSAWRGELEVLLPELREGRTGSGPGHGTAADPGARRRLFDAIVEALTTGHRPLLLAIDDLQWCDADTVELIGFLISSRPASSVLVVGTARNEELTDSHPLASVTSGLGRNEAVREIALSSLDLTTTAELACGLTGEQMSPDQADQFWRETAGNPLFVVEAARAMSTKGEASPSSSLTPTIRSMINSRLERVSPAARPVAELAAVFGRQFAVETLVAAGGRDESEILDAVDELWRRRILREQDGSYDFTHDKIREVTCDQLSPVRRRRLHRSIADAMSASYGREPGPHSAELAAHLEASGQIAEAADAHQRAAEHAAAVFALDEAIASARRGVALLDRLAPGVERDERELGLRLALGAPAVTRHGYNAPVAEESYERSVVLSRRLSRPVEAAALRGLGLASVVSCRFDRSTRFGEELVALDDPVARTEGHYLLGVSSFWRGNLGAAEQHLRSALSSYLPSLGPVHLRYFAQDPRAVCLIRLALVRLWCGDLDAARGLATEARRFAEALEHPMTLGYVLTYSAMIACEIEDLAWFRRDVADGTALADDGLGWVVEAEILYRAWLAFVDGEVGAVKGLEAAVDRVTRLHLTHGLTLLARAHKHAGSLDGALAAVHDGLAWEEEHDQHYTTALLRRIEGDVLEARGDAKGAGAAFASAVEVAEAQGALWLRDQAAARMEQVLSKR
jgi:DNA-binding SARP family transcriptional activator/class 3 adenylate cyclase